MSHFGQKILSKLGLKGLKDQLSSGNTHGSSHLGNQVINADERLLCSHPHGTYPRLARLGDGSILSAYVCNEGPTKILRVGKSTDNGWSFQDFGEVSRGKEVDNLFLLEVAPGHVLGAFRNHDIGPNGPTHFRITVCRSTDGGKSWVFASQAAEKSPPMGLWEPFMRIGRQGEIQLTYSEEYAPDNQCTIMVRSFDLGATWSPPRCLAGENERLRDGMNGIAETWDNGRPCLVMVFETTRYGPFNVEALLSYDDGNTWGWRQEVFRPPPGHNAGSPQIASLRNGSLAVIYMTDEDLPQVQWTANTSTKVIFAGPPNNGQLQWSRSSLVCPERSHWPGIIALDDRNFLGLYEYNGARGRTITWHS